MDWFFGVDMGIYYDPNEPAIVPDGFLSMGVPRIIDSNLRLSYVLWEEQKVPTFVLEVVSQTRRKEYTQKKEQYVQLGILYYGIYNPLRNRKSRLEIYELKGGEYERISGEEPFWLPGINLGLGRAEGTYQGITREWLYWYNEQGERYLTPEEQLLSARQQALEARQQADDAQRQTLEAQQQAREAQEQVAKLAEKLRELGIDPSSLDS
jgi:hypothetical protein